MILKVTASPTEKAKLERLATRAGLSLSNYFRQLAGLPLLVRGGARHGSGPKPKGGVN